jgi:NAD(P)-dependent dehydrogenase (short-subunit alcohol dehydrogenase family)
VKPWIDLTGRVAVVTSGGFGIRQAVAVALAQAGAMTTGGSGRPEKFADLMVFLASDRTSFISGASIKIDRVASA